MDTTVCHYCSRKFCSASNRHRHEKYFHRKDMSETTQGQYDPEIIGSSRSTSDVERESSITTDDNENSVSSITAEESNADISINSDDEDSDSLMISN